MQGDLWSCCVFQDILISGSTKEELVKALDEALCHLEKAGLRVK